MIDTAAVPDVFAASQDGTVGLEEEFAVLDPATLDLVPGFERLRDAAAATTPCCPRPSPASSSRARSRSAPAAARTTPTRSPASATCARRLFALADAGTCGWGRRGPTRGPTTARSPTSTRTTTAASSTGCSTSPGATRASRCTSTSACATSTGRSRACDRLRPVLPLLLAVSASSPFLDGLDSGLHSARTQIFTKSFPRCGVPDAYGSWAAYRDYLDLLVRTGSIVEDTQVWWSVRPHFSFGTVEVRICDAQATAAEAEGLSALIVACVLQAARDEDEGHPSPTRPVAWWRRTCGARSASASTGG